jgi:hypothetical protein
MHPKVLKDNEASCLPLNFNCLRKKNMGIREGMGEGERNDPNIVCTHE